MYTTTVIIPTFNRQDSLFRAVESITQQSRLPDELIIIDQSIAPELSKTNIEKLLIQFKKEIYLKYVCDSSISSLTCARNIGINISTMDIIIFLDDDVLLEIDFIKTIVDTYKINQNISGVAGVMTNFKQNWLQKIFFRIFYLGPFQDRRISIYSNLNKFSKNTFILSNKLGGGLSSFKKVVFKNFRFDENYIGYSPGEDTDFSYRVAKHFKIGITPNARLYHYWSHSLANNDIIKKRTEYHIGGWWYFFKKNVDKNILNYILFWWLNIGFLLSALINASVKKNTAKLTGTLEAFRKIILNGRGFSFLKNCRI